MESIVTEYTNACFFCGRPAEGEHHLVFGTAGRELSEKDGLKVPVCNNCHNMGAVTSRIHGNPMAERLSKMLGQAIWELDWVLKDSIYDSDGADAEAEARRIEHQVCRKYFRERYGKSYL
ncbi:MAG: hypothetical protein LUC95_12745 [Lachnospiraceae bacterium]|nr:hypothetical protein [Lachnospiraceae bacterium]